MLHHCFFLPSRSCFFFFFRDTVRENGGPFCRGKRCHAYIFNMIVMFLFTNGPPGWSHLFWGGRIFSCTLNVRRGKPMREPFAWKKKLQRSIHRSNQHLGFENLVFLWEKFAQAFNMSVEGPTWLKCFLGGYWRFVMAELFLFSVALYQKAHRLIRLYFSLSLHMSVHHDTSCILCSSERCLQLYLISTSDFYMYMACSPSFHHEEWSWWNWVSRFVPAKVFQNPLAWLAKPFCQSRMPSCHIMSIFVINLHFASLFARCSESLSCSEAEGWRYWELTKRGLPFWGTWQNTTGLPFGSLDSRSRMVFLSFLLWVYLKNPWRIYGTYRHIVYLPIWVFPKIMVPPNHPFEQGFPS